MATPKTISLPSLSAGQGGATAAQTASINKTISQINSALAGGITGVGGKSAPTYFTSSGPQNAKGMAIEIPKLNEQVSPVAVPQKPALPTDTAGVVPSILAGLGLSPAVTDKDREDTIRINKELVDSVMGKPASVADEFQETYKKELLPRQQEVNNLKSQIGAITAEGNANVMAVRNQSSSEGGTAGILSAREDAIGRSVAIKTLPLAAQLASAQDNLALAQDYVTKYFDMRSQDIERDYRYKSQVLDSVKQDLTAKEQKIWDVQKMGIEMAFANEKDLLDTQKLLTLNATSRKAPQAVLNAIANAKTSQEAIQAAGIYSLGALEQAQISNIYQNIAESKAKAGEAGVLPSTALASQTAYSKLTTKQKTQADSVNNLVGALSEYKTYLNSKTGPSGINLFGEDAAVLETKLNSILFAAAQAEGTGALQKADRDVIEKIIPNPTNLSGAVNSIMKGGRTGESLKITDQINKYTGNLAGYGLKPTYQAVTEPNKFIIKTPSGSTLDLSAFERK